MDDELAKFYHAIADGLAKHPEWLRDAMDAISVGMAGALAEANERATKKDAAFLSALSLADPARLSADNKAILNQTIAAAINPENASKTELKALERAKEAANG